MSDVIYVHSISRTCINDLAPCCHLLVIDHFDLERRFSASDLINVF